jgi:hypothetical protein
VLTVHFVITERSRRLEAEVEWAKEVVDRLEKVNSQLMIGTDADPGVVDTGLCTNCANNHFRK